MRYISLHNGCITLMEGPVRPQKRPFDQENLNRRGTWDYRGQKNVIVTWARPALGVSVSPPVRKSSLRSPPGMQERS